MGLAWRRGVAGVMGIVLGWSEKEMRAQVEMYAADVRLVFAISGVPD